MSAGHGKTTGITGRDPEIARKLFFTDRPGVIQPRLKGIVHIPEQLVCLRFIMNQHPFAMLHLQHIKQRGSAMQGNGLKTQTNAQHGLAICCFPEYQGHHVVGAGNIRARRENDALKWGCDAGFVVMGLQNMYLYRTGFDEQLPEVMCI